jgi:hypothetical protein
MNVPSAGTAAAAPVFLVAAERSGTTLLRLMLDGHPQIAWPAEFDFALERPAVERGERHREAFWRMLRESRQALQARVEIDESLELPDLVRSLLEQLRRRSSKPVFGVTVHRGFDQLLPLWPDARFIHLLRDGRAVARSHVQMGWAGNAWAASKAWRDAERACQALERALEPSRLLEVRYEELVRNPPGELARICAFLGVPWDARMLSYPTRSRYELPRAERIDGWRAQLSRRDWAQLEAAIGPLLRERGYEPGPYPPADLSAPVRAVLRVGDRAGRIRSAVAIYGAPLWFARLVSRRVGSEAWRRSVNARVRAVDVSRLQ